MYYELIKESFRLSQEFSEQQVGLGLANTKELADMIEQAKERIFKIVNRSKSNQPKGSFALFCRTCDIL